MYCTGIACQYGGDVCCISWPQGLKNIAKRVALLTQIVAEGIEERGFELVSENFFDTIVVKVNDIQPIQRKSRTPADQFAIY